MHISYLNHETKEDHSVLNKSVQQSPHFIFMGLQVIKDNRIKAYFSGTITHRVIIQKRQEKPAQPQNSVSMSAAVS